VNNFQSYSKKPLVTLCGHGVATILHISTHATNLLNTVVWFGIWQKSVEKLQSSKILRKNGMSAL